MWPKAGYATTCGWKSIITDEKRATKARPVCFFIKMYIKMPNRNRLSRIRVKSGRGKISLNAQMTALITSPSKSTNGALERLANDGIPLKM